MLVGIIAPSLELGGSERATLWNNLAQAVKVRGAGVALEEELGRWESRKGLDNYARKLSEAEASEGLDYLLVHGWDIQSVQDTLRAFLRYTARTGLIPPIMPLTVFTGMSNETYESYQKNEGTIAMAITILEGEAA